MCSRFFFNTTKLVTCMLWWPTYYVKLTVFTQLPAVESLVLLTGLRRDAEVITSAEFHPYHCNTLAYSSSKGTIRLIDMRQSALCDRHCKL